MGYDLTGKKATNEAGELFYRNIFGWTLVLNYVLANCPPAITRKCKHWDSNDGDGLNAKDSLRLAECLDQQVNSGYTEEYILEHPTKDHFPDVKIQEGLDNYNYLNDIKEFSAFLRHCGGFEIW